MIEYINTNQKCYSFYSYIYISIKPTRMKNLLILFLMLGILSCQKDIKPATPPNHCAFCHVGNGKNDGTRIVIQDVVTKYCGGNYDEVLKLEGTNTGLAAGAVWKVQCPEAKPE